MRIGPLQPSNVCLCSYLFDAGMRDPPVRSVFSMSSFAYLNSTAAYTSLLQNVTCKKKAAELRTTVTKGNPKHTNADYLGSN
jgi:hypothetical protein